MKRLMSRILNIVCGGRQSQILITKRRGVPLTRISFLLLLLLLLLVSLSAGHDFLEHLCTV